MVHGATCLGQHHVPEERLSMNSRSRRWLGLVQLLVALAASSLVAVIRLSHEAGLATVASDSAFDKGELKQSLLEAQYASIISVSESAQFKRSVDRLEAIAVGSEATGRPRTALLAWSSLSATYFAAKSAISTNPKSGPQPEQHMAYLLDKVAGVPTTGGSRYELRAGTLSRLATNWTDRAALLVVVGLLVGATGIMVPSRISRSKRAKANSQLVMSIGLYFVAASIWCIGWIIA